MVKIFLSHSSTDAHTAEVLADLLRSSLSLSSSEIRCTSVDGYRLPAGANTDEQLRREVLEAPVLIGLISEKSFESAYVLFELGARWGRNEFMAPLLAPGAPSTILRGPLSGLNALSCDSTSQVHQLIQDVAGQLDIQVEPASTFQRLIDKLALPENKSKTASSTQKTTDTFKVSSMEDDYSDSEEIIKRYCKDKWGDDYAMRAYCEEEEQKAVEKLKSSYHSDIPEDTLAKIRKSAARKWPNEFSMRVYTEDEQVMAYRKVNDEKSK